MNADFRDTAQGVPCRFAPASRRSIRAAAAASGQRRRLRSASPGGSPFATMPPGPG